MGREAKGCEVVNERLSEKVNELTDFAGGKLRGRDEKCLSPCMWFYSNYGFFAPQRAFTVRKHVPIHSADALTAITVFPSSVSSLTTAVYTS